MLSENTLLIDLQLLKLKCANLLTIQQIHAIVSKGYTDRSANTQELICTTLKQVVPWTLKTK